MNDQFATAMGRALEQTRAGNPSEATRILQAALNGGGDPAAGSAPARPAPRPTMRRPLGEVVDLLARDLPLPGRSPGQRPARPAIPDGARYETRRHDSAFGARDYRLFVPSPRAEPVQGLVLMLHGCTQTADDFAAGTRMNRHGEAHNLVIVYPEQTRSSNQMGCWNWFRPEDQQRGAGEPALIADLATTIAAEHSIPAGRVFVAGLSAGAAMAAILGVTHPEVFAAVGVHSGLAPGSARDVASAFAVMRGQTVDLRRSGVAPVRSIVFHGSADTTVVPRNAAAVIEAALGAAKTVAIDDPGVPGAAVTIHRDGTGRTLVESWTIDGIGHAWSGGSPEGSYTHASGPDASSEMVRFFLSVAAEPGA